MTDISSLLLPVTHSMIVKNLIVKSKIAVSKPAKKYCHDKYQVISLQMLKRSILQVYHKVSFAIEAESDTYEYKSW